MSSLLFQHLLRLLLPFFFLGLCEQNLAGMEGYKNLSLPDRILKCFFICMQVTWDRWCLCLQNSHPDLVHSQRTGSSGERSLCSLLRGFCLHRSACGERSRMFWAVAQRGQRAALLWGCLVSVWVLFMGLFAPAGRASWWGPSWAIDLACEFGRNSSWLPCSEVKPRQEVGLKVQEGFGAGGV